MTVVGSQVDLAAYLEANGARVASLRLRAGGRRLPRTRPRSPEEAAILLRLDRVRWRRWLETGRIQWVGPRHFRLFLDKAHEGTRGQVDSMNPGFTSRSDSVRDRKTRVEVSVKRALQAGKVQASAVRRRWPRRGRRGTRQGGKVSDGRRWEA